MYDSEKYRFSTSNNDDIDNPEPPMHNGANAFLKLHMNFDISSFHIQLDTYKWLTWKISDTDTIP